MTTIGFAPASSALRSFTKRVLRLRTLGGIHHEQHAINHVHDALDLAAKIGVSGRVHDVDVVIIVFERGVLGADGDDFFLLQVNRIHQAFLP